jgi:hypothetical protein
MPDEYPLTLRQADQARADFAAIADDLDFVKAQLARIPTRKEIAWLVLLGTLAIAALVLAGEALF